MKVKKEISVFPRELQEGDEYQGYGRLVYLSEVTHMFQHEAALVNSCGRLATVRFDDDEKVLITREVETPESVTLNSLFGRLLRIARVDGERVQLKMFEEGDDPAEIQGRTFDVAELIDAIKTVMGME